MNDNIKQTALPKLRFPEFKDDGGWEERPLGSICKFVRGPFGGALKKDIFVKEGYAVYEQAHAIYNNFNQFRYFIDKEKYNALKRFAVAPNDLIMSCSGTMGRLAIIPKYATSGVVNQALLKLTVKATQYLNFIKLSLEIPYNQEKILSQSGGGAIKNVASVNQIKEIGLFLPSINEQTKIADCLSSLDALIDAEKQKLEALQEHKKGLMQQLFPAEGKTIPNLRFPEFRDTGGWEEKPLHILAKKVISKNKNEGITRVLTNSAAKGVIDQRNFFGKDIANKGNLSSYFVVKKGDYIYNPRISNIAPVGPISKNKLALGIISPLYIVFRFTNTDNDFYEHYFKFYHWHNYIYQVSNSGARHDRISITSNDFINMPLPFPSINEQTKIADCLSSLDALMEAENQKLKALQEHKKGLMQQLFPATKEAMI